MFEGRARPGGAEDRETDGVEEEDSLPGGFEAEDGRPDTEQDATGQADHDPHHDHAEEIEVGPGRGHPAADGEGERPGQAEGQDQGGVQPRVRDHPPAGKPSARTANAATARASSSSECAADIWVRMRASPIGTTG